MISYTYLTELEDLSSFKSHQISDYKYLALFDFDVLGVDNFELEAMRISLANFLKQDCLIINKQDLDKVEEDCAIKKLARIFSKDRDLIGKSYLGIATIQAKINDNFYFTPHVHEFSKATDVNESLFYLHQLNQALERIQQILSYKSLRDFSLNESNRRKSMVCPKGHLILKLREQNFDSRKVASFEEVKISTSKNKERPDESIWQKAEESSPVSRVKLQAMSIILKTNYGDLIYDDVPVKERAFLQLRHESGLSITEILEEFKISDEIFFHFLEIAPTVPSNIFVYAFSRYSKLLPEKKLKGKDLIDLDIIAQEN